MAKRASLIDKGRSGGYWSRIIERGARSFENYVIHKMMLKGYHNDYLANVTSIEEFSRDPGRYPYLLEGEIQPVAEAFDNLFATIQTKETDSGVAMFHTGSPVAVEPISAKDFDVVVARLTDGWNTVSRYRIVPIDDYADNRPGCWRQRKSLAIQWRTSRALSIRAMRILSVRIWRMPRKLRKR
ncbi:MAG: hypothetical protein IPJ52_01960 [Rhodocyclaceae bacterium]|nr:hypothetical protein [Rhodocyclaceae bacterium]